MAQPTGPGYFRALWYKWRSLKLPWRRRWLCGFDLQGNTYWEFTNQITKGRPRRIAKYPSQTHFGDVQLSPAWLQWLRHTRNEPPSVEEQQIDIQRQAQMKQLAAAADERWRKKESYLDAPSELGQTGPQLEPGSGQRASAKMQEDSRQGLKPDQEGAGQQDHRGVAKKEDPWAKHAGSPGEQWQPQAWTPSSTAKR